MSSTLFSKYFTEEDKLVLGLDLLNNERRKADVVQTIVMMQQTMKFEIPDKYWGPLVLTTFDFTDSRETAMSLLRTAAKAVSELYSFSDSEYVVNVFGDLMSPEDLILDVRKLIFVMTSMPQFKDFKEELDKKLFSNFSASGSKPEDAYAAILAAKILLFFNDVNALLVKNGFIQKFGKAKSFKLIEINNSFKEILRGDPKTNHNITLEMVNNQILFRNLYNELFSYLKDATLSMTWYKALFVYDFGRFQNAVKKFIEYSECLKNPSLPTCSTLAVLDAKGQVPKTLIDSWKNEGVKPTDTDTCQTCTIENDYMAAFKMVTDNVRDMFICISAFNALIDMANDDERKRLTQMHKAHINDTVSLYVFPKNNCNCLSQELLNNIAQLTHRYKENLSLIISDFIDDDDDYILAARDAKFDNHEFIKYIMDNIVVPNGRLVQTPNARVFKITREFWLSFLNFQSKTKPKTIMDIISEHSET